MKHSDTSVLIAGGGAVGLALAAELGVREIPAILVDPIVPRTTDDLASMRDVPAPRAKLTNIRSMEHARRWGIAERLREIAPLSRDYPRNVLFVTSLFGHRIAKIESAFGYNGGDDDLFAEGPLQCPQFLVEAVLRDHARTHESIECMYGAKFESFQQDADAGVTAVVTMASGERRTIRASYLVGCDGARSTVRRNMDVTMEGQSALAGSLNIIFRTPRLRELMQTDPAIHYWTINAQAPGCCGPLDGRDIWWAVLGKVAPTMEAAAALDPSAIVNAAAGRDIDAEILDTTVWAPHRLLASRYRAGRVFLAGDAAHLHSPFGGHGMNLGIGDAVDIGWKLAAVVKGFADEALLDSYEPERRTLALRVIDEATRNLAAVSNAYVRPDLDDDGAAGAAARKALEPEIFATKLPEFRSAGLVCGYTYDGSPTIIADGTPKPLDTVVSFFPTDRPGSRAPHRWLGAGTSLYDRFGRWFTLLCAPADADAARRFAAQAADSGVPVEVLAIDDVKLWCLYRRSFTLIRPDQHVAWHADVLPERASSILDVVLGATSHAATR